MGIENHLKTIKEGVFGRDVRQAIHDGIKQAYDDASINGNANMEVSLSRGSYNTLSERLNTEFENILNSLKNMGDASPKGVFPSLSDLQSTYPSGAEGTYLTTDNGHWYLYNGTSWIDGGVYQALKFSDSSIAFRLLDETLKEGFFYEQKSVGYDISEISSAAASAGSNAIFINANSKATTSGYLKELSLFAKATGTIHVVIGSLSGNTFTKRTGFDALVKSTGQVTLNSVDDFTKIEVFENEMVGIVTVTSGVLGYTNTPGDYYYLSNVTTSITNFALQHSLTNTVHYSFSLDVISNPTNIVNSLVQNTNATSYNKSKGFVLEKIEDYTNFPTNWTKVGTWDNSNKTLKSNVAESRLVSNDVYGLDHRTQRWEVHLTNGTVIDIGTEPDPQRIPTVGTVIRISTVDNSVNFLSRWTDGTNLTVIKSEIIPFTIAENNIAVEIEKDGRNAIVTIYQVNGKGKFITSRMNTDLLNYEQGCLQGKPQLSLRQGTVEIIKHEHIAYGDKNPFIYLVGDSITEGRGVTDDLKYGRLLQNYFGRENVLISGIGGACFDEAYKRIQSECKNVTPKNVIINLGTNTAAFEYLQMIIDYFVSKGSHVFVCTLPDRQFYTDPILQMPQDHIMMHIALNDDSGVKIAEYYPSNDHLHPNAKGNQVMFDRIIQDALVKMY